MGSKTFRGSTDAAREAGSAREELQARMDAQAVAGRAFSKLVSGPPQPTQTAGQKPAKPKTAARRKAAKHR